MDKKDSIGFMDNLKQVSLYSPQSYLFEYGVEAPNLHMSKRLQMSVNYPIINGYDNAFIEGVNNEISTSISRSILEIMTTEEDAISVVGDSEVIKSNKLWSYVCFFDFIIISPSIARLIDMMNTNHIFSSSGSYTSEYATIGRTKVYIDNFKKWDDPVIICGYNNSFTYNYQFHVITDKFNEFSFNSQLSYVLSYDVVPYKYFKKLYLLENKDIHYDKWISKIITENREKKLDILLK